MRKLLIFLLLSVAASATTVTGIIKDPVSGNLFNGTMTFRLTYNGGRQISTNTALVQPAVPTPIAINNGSLPSGFTLVGNDDMAPRGMAWIASWYDWNGTLLRSSPYYVTGSTFDLGSAVPTPITTSNINLLDLVGLRLFSATKFATGNLSAFYSDVSGDGQLDLATVGGVIKVHFGATGNHYIKQGKLVIGDAASTVWTLFSLYGTDTAGTTLPANSTTNPAGAFITLMSTGASSHNGGGVLFGSNSNQYGAAIRYDLTNGNSNSQGVINFMTRYAAADTDLTNKVFSVQPAKVQIGAPPGSNGGGVEPNGGGLKMSSVSTGSVPASSNVVVTVNWGTAFADTSYLHWCSVSESTGNLTVQSATSATTTGIGYVVHNNDAGGAHTGTLACLAIHL